MALLMKLEHESGLVIDNAYWKITNVSGDKNCLYINCEAFINKEASNSGKCSLAHFSNAFKPVVGDGAEDFIRQAYKYIKTLPEFANAVDC